MGAIPGCKSKRQNAKGVVVRWNLKGIANGGFMDWKAIAGWSEPITFARTAKGRRFFPLDVRLKLRNDHWSEGAARVAARQGLQTKSFDKASELYTNSTGGSMSSDSVRRITEGFGQALEDKRVREAQQVYEAKAPQLAQAVVSV